MRKHTKIAGDFKVEDWLKLRKELNPTTTNNWSEGVKVLKARIESRFLNPIDAIKEGDQRNGFGFTISLVLIVLLVVLVF